MLIRQIFEDTHCNFNPQIFYIISIHFNNFDNQVLLMVQSLDNFEDILFPTILTYEAACVFATCITFSKIHQYYHDVIPN